jgi:hypothetical protein
MSNLKLRLLNELAGGKWMAFDINRAEKFVETVDLKDVPRGILAQDAAAEAGAAFNEAKNQALVVGSGVFSFSQGVDAKVREAISDSALLAQLVANKAVKFEDQPEKWFDAYSDVLQNVGWVLQDRALNDYSAIGTAAEVNEQIIAVITAILGPSPAALSIITSTVKALKAMQQGSSWFTIFSRETQKSKVARFQIGVAEKDKDGGVLVSLLACLIEAKSDITQVLLFKFRQSNASFKAYGNKVSLNQPSLTRLGPAIQKKVQAYQTDYLSSIKDL